MRLRIAKSLYQNKRFTDTTIPDRLEIKENGKVISGQVMILRKISDEDRKRHNYSSNWLSKRIMFVAFKSKIDLVTETTLRQSNGKTFNCEFDIHLIPVFEKVKGDDFIIIIKKAWMDEKPTPIDYTESTSNIWLEMKD